MILPPLPRRDHRSGDGLQREQRAGDIDRKQPVVARTCDLDDRRKIEQRSVVDQDVDAAGASLDRACTALSIEALVGDVEVHGRGGTAQSRGRLLARRQDRCRRSPPGAFA